MILEHIGASAAEIKDVQVEDGEVAVAFMGLGLDAWWDEPAYKAAQGTFAERGAFILGKLRDHDASKLKDVLADVFRAIPDPMDITRFEWETILRYLGASPEEIRTPGDGRGR